MSPPCLPQTHGESQTTRIAQSIPHSQQTAWQSIICCCVCSLLFATRLSCAVMLSDLWELYEYFYHLLFTGWEHISLPVKLSYRHVSTDIYVWNALISASGEAWSCCASLAGQGLKSITEFDQLAVHCSICGHARNLWRRLFALGALQSFPHIKAPCQYLAEETPP